MEVSNEIKEDIRKTQSDLRNAIRLHQVWIARLQEDENNIHIKSKVLEAEKEIIAAGQTQKLVVDRLRRELELYQQRLKAKNKQINIENDNRYVAQQLRDHQIQYRNRNRAVSLLKPSVLSEIHIKTENNEEVKENMSDSEINSINEKENSNHSETDDKDKYQRNFSQLPNKVHDSRSNFANALNKVKESFIGSNIQHDNDWQEQRSDSDSSPGVDPSPTPSPPLLPNPDGIITQEIFMSFIGLMTPVKKEILEKNRSERRKRAVTSTNKNDFLYGNFDMIPKRKKYNQFPYLQTHSDPPQTRSAKLRKQQSQNKSSREGSPSGSSTENKVWGNSKPAWAASLPAGLSVEPVYSQNKKICHGCGRNDVPSLLVCCLVCSVWQHTGCSAEGRCLGCGGPVPDPAACAAPASPASHASPTSHASHPPHPSHPSHPSHPTHPAHPAHLYRGKEILREMLTDGLLHMSESVNWCNKLAERKRLQEKNIELCVELRKLEARAASLKENLDDHNAEKRQLLSDQIKTQRNLQKLLDFISQFKETSISIRSTSVSDSGSEISKSNED